MDGFLDLLCELQELLGFTHDGLSIIKEPRMRILFQISVKRSECWKERVLGVRSQSRVFLDPKVGIRNEALAFLS